MTKNLPPAASAGALAYRRLRRDFFRRTDAPEAVKLFRERAHRTEAQKRSLYWLLRDHEDHPEGVGGIEVEQRNAFDSLLGYYGTIEVAILGGVLDLNDVPRSQRHEALAVLSHPAVELFYREHYPIRMPGVFRARLEGNWKARQYDALALGLTEHFIDLSARRTLDYEIDTFLWLLDDGFVDNRGLGELVEVLEDKREVARILAQRDSEDGFDSVIRGLGKFFVFSQEFELLLDACRDYPVLQSAMWHRHSYWYEQWMDDLDQVASGLVAAFRGWSENKEATRASGDRLLATLRRLGSKEFAAGIGTAH